MNSRLKYVGNICAKARRNAGLSQFDVAAQTGYTRSNIAMFESGRCNNVMILIWYLENVICEEILLSELKEIEKNG